MLVYLCWVMALGSSVVTTGITLRQLFEMRRRG
jgi:hypothetical protein